MKKGDEMVGRISRVDFMNKGIVKTDEGDVVVKGGIPGQTVRFRIKKKRKGKCEGILLEVIEKSPLQVEDPVCGEFPACGGCLYQTMSYDDQLLMKEEQVKRLISDHVNEDGGQWLPAIASPEEWQYRNKMEFSFGDLCKDGPMTLGLHKRGTTYDVMTCADCRIVHPDFGAILVCTLDYCNEKSLTHYKKMAHKGYLRHLLIRCSRTTGEILVHIVTTSEINHDFSELCSRVRGLSLEGKIAGFIHITNDSPADVVKSDKTHILFGTDRITEKILGLEFKVSTFSFFQTNTLGAEKLYSAAREFIGNVGGMTVFDLYSGTGTIAQILAPVAKKVIGVEIVEDAVEAAKENALLNNLPNCEFISGDVLKVLDEIGEKPDFIVLDPPRDGIHPKAIGKILAYGVENLIYISCKPTSLQRDLIIMKESGYKVKKVRCIDMFPWTGHVETVVLLSKVNTK